MSDSTNNGVSMGYYRREVGHDPLCPVLDPKRAPSIAFDGTPMGCKCALIARVRADERRRVARIHAHDCPVEVRNGVAYGDCQCGASR